MEPVYKPVIGVALGVLKAMRWQVRVTGAEHIPLHEPAVIASNHIGYLDFVFVGFAARTRGRLVRFMAKKEAFDHRISGPLMRGMKHIAVDRFGDPKTSFEASVDALRRGEVIGMFPEGTISRSFVPRAGKSGAARMAMAAGALLIPSAVWGTQRILTKGRPKNFERGIVVSVDVGEPIRYEPGEDARDVTKRLMSSIQTLVSRAERRYPQRPRSDDDRWWLPAHLGGSAPTVAEADEMAAREADERRERRRAG